MLSKEYFACRRGDPCPHHCAQQTGEHRPALSSSNAGQCQQPNDFIKHSENCTGNQQPHPHPTIVTLNGKDPDNLLLQKRCQHHFGHALAAHSSLNCDSEASLETNPRSLASEKKQERRLPLPD
ncbi:hypothetical protein E5288_WYG019992 [Bos mutus]|uniref:Uncharacterized protein n=1 Tax=Bos mutus TaxID=72004 RepID=A0A6B0RFX6_9CETA|nr:hypothetical protein [Bos mutus]